MNVSYDELTREAERIIHANQERAACTFNAEQRQFHLDIALGAFVLWTHLASTAALRGQASADQVQFERDRNSFETLLERPAR
ncbi:hypothetical protein KTD33_00300 [Burkholderia gladioli]|uniref:hypothetical protein n=1 Tax=Burkholderia gladioli TaxID=28095 RepID=UPI001C251006|nr:hypothetical protein [Burkholderia gladioli]MBU9192973.1 hypothetical protein [Burkholderia gladioli]